MLNIFIPKDILSKCSSIKNNTCKSHSVGDRKHVAISVAWSTGYRISLRPSLPVLVLKTQKGSCSSLVPPINPFHFQWFYTQLQQKIIRQAVGTYLSHVFEPSDQISVNSRCPDRLHQVAAWPNDLPLDSHNPLPVGPWLIADRCQMKQSKAAKTDSNSEVLAVCPGWQMDSSIYSFRCLVTACQHVRYGLNSLVNTAVCALTESQTYRQLKA